MPAERSKNTAREAAVALALDDFQCFPVWPSKCPATPRGILDATDDPFALLALWEKHPRAPLVGVRTGEASGVDALDIDAKHREAGDWWRENRDRLPRTRAHRSRGGGLHLFFQHAPVLRCRTSKIARGVDVKADGGCVTWWPANGLPVLCDAEPAPWPARLLAQL